MTQVKKYPRSFEMTGESVNVIVQFFRDDEGLEQVNAIVVSKALPDERQVKFSHAKYNDGCVLTSSQSSEVPKPRPPDPEKVGREIRGDLQGKYGLLNQKYFPGTLEERVIKMTGGFGCNADGIGRKLFGEYVVSGKDFAGRREDLSRFATIPEIEAARKLAKKA